MLRSKFSLVFIVFMIVFGFTADSNAASLWLNGNDLYSSHGAARNYQPGDIRDKERWHGNATSFFCHSVPLMIISLPF